MEPGRQPAETAGDFRVDPEMLRFGLAAILGLVFVVLIAVDLVGGAPEGRAVDGQGVVLTESELLARAARIETPAYWVGRRAGIDRFELERGEAGDLFVRYLRGGRTGGSSVALAVGSYPVPDARASLGSAARSSGQELVRLPGLTALAPPGGTRALVAFDDQPGFRIELFSSEPGEAADLVMAGDLVPVGWEPIE